MSATKMDFVEPLIALWLRRELAKLSKLAVALPQRAIRSQVVDFDSEPDSRTELDQMLEWKIERELESRSNELRLSKRRLFSEGPRVYWFVSAVHQHVIEQYEKLFVELGWQSG
jgi:Tfp pilus assembly PilM family ATPase